MIPPLLRVCIVGWNLRLVSAYLSSRGMALRRPASHLRRAPDRRRSGDEIYWESLISEDGFSPGVSHPLRAPRPQSAIEGGQLDKWLEHLRATQSNSSTPVHNPSFYDRTTFVPIFDKVPGRCAERQTGTPSFSRDSSSWGSSSLCESSLGSQESLQTGLLSFSERRESCERAHIMQAPRKEQTQFSYLAPVKIGWLPIQRRVMRVEDACSQDQFLDHSSDHVRDTIVVAYRALKRSNYALWGFPHLEWVK